MIPVQQQPEPANFDALVRRPGRQFLRRRGHWGNRSQLPRLWRKISKELHEAYGGICAYTCMYLVGTWSVDHFRPKSTHEKLAYEWCNYRLCSDRVNSRKGEDTGLLDPFQIKSQWFELIFPACLVAPGRNLPQSSRPAAEHTIKLLMLNDDDDLVQERCNIIMCLRDGLVQLGFLEQRYPFIADELKRQNLLGRLDSLFRNLPK